MARRIKPVRALIFSVSIGSGHDSVANALKERLKEDIPGSQLEIVDTFQYINSVLHKVVFGSYMETLKFTPKVWGYLYNQAEKGERLVDIGQIMSKLLSPKLELLLKEFNPEVILTTHAFPTGILAVLKRRQHITMPLGAVVTDYHVHNFWIHHGVDRYFLPAPDLDYNLLRNGILPETIRAFGIPIRRQFSEELDTDIVREELQIGHLPTVLVMGGGLGLGRIEVIVKELLEFSNFQVVVVAGKNKTLHDCLFNLRNPRLKVFGFLDNIAKVIAACDIVISKPGGVTTAEVLALKKPLVIYTSLPGQEDRNTDYLLNKGAAVKIRKLDMLVPEIISLWNNPLRRKHMEQTAIQLGAPLASRLVWDELTTLMDNK